MALGKRAAETARRCPGLVDIKARRHWWVFDDRKRGCVLMIWVPLAGGGALNGYRYRDTLQPLCDAELIEAYDDAFTRVTAVAQAPRADIGPWRGHAAALSVYVQWAVQGLRGRNLITAQEWRTRLEWLAKLQQRNGLYRGYPGLHYGRPSSWEAPSWWGTDVHAQHRAALIAQAPQHYSVEVFMPRVAG